MTYIDSAAITGSFLDRGRHGYRHAWPPHIQEGCTSTNLQRKQMSYGKKKKKSEK